MVVSNIALIDFLVFRGEFKADFCAGVNVLFGGNGTGKTTLLKIMYGIINDKVNRCFYSTDEKTGVEYGYGYASMFFSNGASAKFQQKNDYHSIGGNFITYPPDTMHNTATGLRIKSSQAKYIDVANIYIPEKDMLSHSNGLLAWKNERHGIPFDDTLTDIIWKAQLPIKKEMEVNPLCSRISKIIGGDVKCENDIFYIVNDKNKTKISFSYEASGYKKFGLLWKLIRNGLLEPGAILFWDEPENSVNPELLPVLVDILLELSRNGVQIFIATHSEIFTSYFAVNRNRNDSVMFFSLYKDKDGDVIKTNFGSRFDLLEPNSLKAEIVNLYEKEIERGLSGNG